MKTQRHREIEKKAAYVLQLVARGIYRAQKLMVYSSFRDSPRNDFLRASSERGFINVAFARNRKCGKVKVRYRSDSLSQSYLLKNWKRLTLRRAPCVTANRIRQRRRYTARSHTTILSTWVFTRKAKKPRCVTQRRKYRRTDERGTRSDFINLTADGTPAARKDACVAFIEGEVTRQDVTLGWVRYVPVTTGPQDAVWIPWFMQDEIRD
ncbi:hypothetical protein DBV15_07534 [Temnothorax longispinosus]|uniref:Uncharacterized protein n=1 Tax=Temnothorax longispinosus TaxID=300112 RepID=A0A4S2JUU8_9HYME|nr:hypothetical protein DBV15_07534 [Temnothorax longispinosus]